MADEMKLYSYIKRYFTIPLIGGAITYCIMSLVIIHAPFTKIEAILITTITINILIIIATINHHLENR